eukprot:SAG31_NODE_2357_length_5874_cov_4.759827_6_plen_55_part_00
MMPELSVMTAGAAQMPFPGQIKISHSGVQLALIISAQLRPVPLVRSCVESSPGY